MYKCALLNPKKGNAKECSNYRTIALISYASIVMLKILPARLLCPWTVPGKNTGVVAIPFSRGSSPLRGQSWVSCTEGRFFTI